MNISQIKDCYGCGVCATACPFGIINMHLNQDGFLEPYLEKPTKCTNCGLCLSVCSYVNDIHEAQQSPLHSYASWSLDLDTRKRSSSGGVSYELAKQYIETGNKFCGVFYNTSNNRAEHYIASSLKEIQLSIGSKYIQSNTIEAFCNINRKEQYMVIGTPCQIGSFRRYIKKYNCENNFVLIDFFCHGVPSKLMWDKYLNEHSKGLGVIQHISWRNKQRGWKRGYCISIDGINNKYQSYKEDGDDFFTLFLGNACLNNACYESCKFKYNHSLADIRIGDFWGTSNNNEGISALVTFTLIGEETIKKANIALQEMSFDQVAKGQMRECARKPWYYAITMRIIKGNIIKLSVLSRVIRYYLFILRQLKKIKSYV